MLKSFPSFSFFFFEYFKMAYQYILTTPEWIVEDGNVCWVIHIYVYPNWIKNAELGMYLRFIKLIHNIVVDHLQIGLGNIVFNLSNSLCICGYFVLYFNCWNVCCVNKKRASINIFVNQIYQEKIKKKKVKKKRDKIC